MVFVKWIGYLIIVCFVFILGGIGGGMCDMEEEFC